MKRWISVVLVALLSMSFFACQNGGNDKNTRKEGNTTDTEIAADVSAEETEQKNSEQNRQNSETEKAEEFKNDIIVLGSYEQDNDASNGTEPIEWTAIKKEDGKVLVASKYCLEFMAFKAGNMSRDLSWEHSTLREWMNNEFFFNAFTDEEQEKILTVTVSGSKNSQTNMKYGETEDKIFLLSYEEATSLFPVSDLRVCEPTAYVKALTENSYSSAKNYWWLRTPGFGATQAAYIDSKGQPELTNGIRLDERALVRPAFWMIAD